MFIKLCYIINTIFNLMFKHKLANVYSLDVYIRSINIKNNKLITGIYIGNYKNILFTKCVYVSARVCACLRAYRYLFYTLWKFCLK